MVKYLPYNFFTGKYEFLNYPQLCKDIESNFTFPLTATYLNEINFINYFKEWCKFLGGMDKETLSFISDESNIKKLNESLNKEPEFFQYTIPIGDQNLRWTINIENIIHDIKSAKKLNVKKVPYQEFNKIDSKYIWQPTPEQSNRNFSHNYPIILLPLPTIPETYLVIDGNHRLTKYRNSSAKTNVLILPSEIGRNSYYFPSQFDQFIFTYFIDQMMIFNRIKYHDLSRFPDINAEWFTSKISTWFNND